MLLMYPHLRRAIAHQLDQSRKQYLAAVERAQRDPSCEAGQILHTAAQELDIWSGWVEIVLEEFERGVPGR